MTKTFTAHKYKTLRIEPQTSSSLLNVISLVNKRKINNTQEMKEREKEGGKKEQEKDEGGKRWEETERERKRSEFVWKTQAVDVRAEVAVLVPVSMATQMCCQPVGSVALRPC